MTKALLFDLPRLIPDPTEITPSKWGCVFPLPSTRTPAGCLHPPLAITFTVGCQISSFMQHRLRSSTAGENNMDPNLPPIACSAVFQLFSPLRRLYFAQLHLRPHSSRVCVGPPGCGVSSGSDGSTQGLFYSPLSAGEGATFSEIIRTFC